MVSLIFTRKMLVLVTTLLTGMVAGEFYIFSYGVNDAFVQLSGSEYTQAMRLINFSVRDNPFFGAVFFGALATPIVALCLFWGRYRSPMFLLYLAGYVLFFVGTFLVTFQINIPLNYYLESWDLASPASDWQETRNAWNQANLVRTWAAVLASSFYLVAISFYQCTEAH